MSFEICNFPLEGWLWGRSVVVITVAAATDRRLETNLKQMYYVYILKSLKNRRLYTGQTNNLRRRLIEHNSGASEYTKFTKPFKLLYFEKFVSRLEAIHREQYLKTEKGREGVRKILNESTDFNLGS